MVAKYVSNWRSPIASSISIDATLVNVPSMVR